MDEVNSRMNNIFNVLTGLNPSHEKALKHGVYNAVALFLLCIISAAGYGLYIVLNPFVKPLIWALLCGAVLFPFKYFLTTVIQSWFAQIETSSLPFIINFVVLPIQIVNESSEILGTFLRTYIKTIIVSISLILVSMILYNYTPNILTCLMWRLFLFCNGIVDLFISACNIYMIIVILVGYVSIIYTYWSPNNSIHFHYLSFVIWFLLSLYISNIVGSYPVFIFVLLQSLYVIGFFYEVLLIMENQKLPLIESIYFTLKNSTICTIQEEFDSTEKINDAEGTKDIFSQSELKSTFKATIPSRFKMGRRSLTFDANTFPHTEQDEVDTNKYMYGALYACVGMIFWKHRWMLHLLIIPISYYAIRQFGSCVNLWKVTGDQLISVGRIVQNWCIDRHRALIPANIRGLYKICIIVDQKVTSILKGSIDAVATTAVILALLIFTICASIFITIQIYAEGMHVIRITGDILNTSLMNNPDIDWVPEQWEQSVNSVLDNAYTYGRSAISDGVKSLVKDIEPAKAEHMEKKVLELWDRLYQAWMMSNEPVDKIGPTVDATAIYSVWESFKDSYGNTPFQLFNMTSIQNFAKENVVILMSVLDSVWSIVKGNMSVILNLFTELFYIVLMSGTAVLNFTLSMVVFFTALFYLLNSSSKIYKPIEMITQFSPISCHRFVMALQEAVIGVFTVTFKLASFFGMWTWFIHNLFQVKIVYLPSAFAAMLGAVPFLDAYFACIPATIELWFTRGSMISILFFLCHFLPCNIVVTEFYKEIKGGGHPYLTGLSIAGGIFCLGVEGAIFGPLLLCCVMVVINLSRRYLQSPSEEVEAT
ncbi:transmembrane protein 245 isoform X2 [Prorops nasuta]|uniref:transmembrane protein 245 isoform X2 n=1 Tax=Prorops nasuta TaxID=863751 RepID=UPI0034CDE6AB